VFAVEELARVHVRFFRTALFTSVIIAGLAAQGFLGPYLYLGYPDVGGLSFRIFPALLVMAFAAGSSGAFMCKLILRISAWKNGLLLWVQAAYVAGAGILIASLYYFVDAGVPGSGKGLMSRLLFTGNKECSGSAVLMRIPGPLICFNVDAAGGAALGGWFSGLVGISGAAANVIVLAGIVGFLTAVTRTPFTSAILVLEMTDRHNVIFHLLPAAMVARMAASLVDKHSLYEQIKARHKAALEPVGPEAKAGPFMSPENV
jgi:H+/Cl- antiporter ClcA